MKILVTGSEGFIGSHLVEKLVKNGHSVNAMVLYNSFNHWGWLDTLDNKIKKNINVIMGDIRDYSSVYNSAKSCNAIINLAALIGIPYSYRAPMSYFETNVKGTINVLEVAKKLNISKVIQTSTSEVYGSAQFTPMTESHPFIGQSPYSASKIASDQVSLSYNFSFDTPVTILRPFNTFGPRQSLRAVIPSIILQGLNNRNSISKINIGSLTPTRDFNYIEDIVDAYVMALSNKNCIGEFINLATGNEISIKEVMTLIAEILNTKFKIVKKKERVRPIKSEVRRLCGSNKKALKLLNWKPKYSSKKKFKESLIETIEWYKNSNNLKNYKDVNNFAL
jgi:NAD dependent epimerase/dehydratase